MTTIFRKELKDVLRWTPLGMIVIGLLCWQQIPGDTYECDGSSASIASIVAIGGSLFALALGLLQSMSDLRTDAWALLLHRPIAASDVFRGKLAVGFVAHTLAWAIPLLFAGIYLESIGPESLPVAWSNMVLPAVCCTASFLFQPAGMWIACREARWIGTKCLPLVLPVVASVTASIVALLIVHPPTSWEWALVVSAVIVVIMSWIIIAAAKHALTHQTFLPAAASEESSSWSNIVGLGTASIIVVATALGFVETSLMLWRPVTPDMTAHRLAVAADGQLWEIEETWKAPRQRLDDPIHRSGRRLTGNETEHREFEELDDTWREQPIVTLTASASRFSFGFLNGYQYLSTTASSDHGGAVYLFERDGRLYVYGQYSGWLGTVTPLGVFKPNEEVHGAFRKPSTLEFFRFSGKGGNYMSLGGQRVLADDSGIYQLDFDAQQVRKLADGLTEVMAITLPTDGQSHASLWTRGDQIARRFSIRPRTETETLPSAYSELVKATHRYPLANVELTPTGEWSLSWIEEPNETLLSVSSFADNGAVFVTHHMAVERTYQFGNSDGTLSASGDLPDFDYAGATVPSAPIFLPPALTAGSAILSAVVPGPNPTSGVSLTSWLLVSLHSLIACAGAFLLARSRSRSRQARMGWLIAGALGGISAWLAVIVIYPRLVVEQCTACQRRRRVDTDRCEHCGVDWEVPDSEGIELIGPRDLGLTSAAGAPA